MIPFSMRNDKLVDEFCDKLRPITLWHTVTYGTRIFHKSSNHPQLCDMFVSFDFGTNLVTYIATDGERYSRSYSGWFYYEKDIALRTEADWNIKHGY